MVAGAEVIVCPKSLPVLEVPYYSKETRLEEIESINGGLSIDPTLNRVRDSEPVSSSSQSDIKPRKKIPDSDADKAKDKEFPNLRSGSFADIGPRRFMEDEHIRIDDLSSHLGSLFKFPKPSAFYGVFDGHGGPEAAAYIRKNVLRLFFEDVNFPQMPDFDEVLPEEIHNCLRKAFLLADQALADDSGVSNSCGTTALTALVLGRHLMVANAGDCRAVLSRNGEAVDMSQDHRPIYSLEKQRVEELGGYVDGGYLNGVLSVSRALGDWDMKLPHGSPSPLIAEPECKQVVLTEEDEFLIIACDGIWDVMSSQQAVNVVRQGLQRHDDPERCARELVLRALQFDSFDNLTVVVVCFSSFHGGGSSLPQQRKLRYCSLSAQALCSLQRWLDNSGCQ
ncbi:probable protein phosphatase 2C 2 [Cucurbita moschata]|uniref:protein-serine/threonine phosphatase n=1 Tax=Cucurbita moschata TaxID=3662 RepID=A0A6J1GP92_CUCMO|nr:probable protein phosphatase 2C 2 [Cucurbita moschata]